MNSIDAGKHNSTFNWFSDKNETKMKGPSITIPITQNSPVTQAWNSQPQLPMEERQFVSPLVDSLRTQSPKEPSRIYLPLPEKQDSSPLVDTLRPRSSPKEPSRIHRPLHGAHKHPYPSSVTDSPVVELPLKRLKVDWTYSSPSMDLYDFNTISGSYEVDFNFSRRVPSDISSLEEAERADRIQRKANPVLLGRFSRVQKELLSKVNSSRPTIIEKTSGAVLEKTSELIESISEVKDSILEKGQELIDSTKDAIIGHPLRQSLNNIAKEAEAPVPTFRPLLPLYCDSSDPIEFVWPRVSESFKAAEELARDERIDNKPSPLLYNQWKSINAEILNKWTLSKPGFIYGEKAITDKADSLVGKATKAIEDAIQYTTEKMEQLGLAYETSGHDLEWFRLQEEKERARRINESPLVPSARTNKARVDQQLLDAARRIRSQQ